MSKPQQYLWVQRSKLVHIYEIRALGGGSYQMRSLCPRAWDRVVGVSQNIEGIRSLVMVDHLKGPVPEVQDTCTVCDRHYRRIRREA